MTVRNAEVGLMGYEECKVEETALSLSVRDADLGLNVEGKRLGLMGCNMALRMKVYNA